MPVFHNRRRSIRPLKNGTPVVDMHMIAIHTWHIQITYVLLGDQNRLFRWDPADSKPVKQLHLNGLLAGHVKSSLFIQKHGCLLIRVNNEIKEQVPARPREQQDQRADLKEQKMEAHVTDPDILHNEDATDHHIILKRSCGSSQDLSRPLKVRSESSRVCHPTLEDCHLFFS